MLEARLEEADLLKKVLDAVKELVTDANFDCSDEGIKLQAMDNSHVALVSLNLVRSGFTQYRCDRDMSLGMSLTSLQKIVKCAANNDMVTLRADESQDVLALLFEAKHSDRVGEYEMKLMDIDQEHLGIPDTVYDAEIDLPSAEFARIIRDLKELGESVKIEVSKDGVRFSAEGDIGNASVTLKPTEKRGRAEAGSDDSEEEGSDDEGSDKEDEEKSDEEEEEEEEEPKDEDEDVEIQDAEDEDTKPAIAGSDEEGAAAADGDAGGASPKKRATVPDSEDEDGEPSAKKVKGEKGAKDAKKEKADAKKAKEKARKEKEKDKKRKEKEKAVAKKKKESEKKKAAANKGKAKKEPSEKGMEIKINLQQAVSLTFSIKYLSNFAKSTPLSDRVQLHMSNEVPLLVQYSFDAGHVRYYLAPKIADE